MLVTVAIVAGAWVVVSLLAGCAWVAYFSRRDKHKRGRDG